MENTWMNLKNPQSSVSLNPVPVRKSEWDTVSMRPSSDWLWWQTEAVLSQWERMFRKQQKHKSRKKVLQRRRQGRVFVRKEPTRIHSHAHMHTVQRGSWMLLLTRNTLCELHMWAVNNPRYSWLTRGLNHWINPKRPTARQKAVHLSVLLA